VEAGITIAEAGPTHAEPLTRRLEPPMGSTQRHRPRRRALGDLRIGGGTGRQGLCGSRARLARASSHESSACVWRGFLPRKQRLRAEQRRAFGELRSGTGQSGARLGIYALAAAPAAKVFAASERARRRLPLTKAAPACAAAAHVRGATQRHRAPMPWWLPSADRSMLACFRGRSACARSSGSRLGSYASAAAPAAKAFAAP
jgi:hypothetical protein